LEIVAGNRDVT